MRNVNRPPMPPSLQKNARYWLGELCAALSSPEEDSSRIKQLRSRYDRPDVRAGLEEMYDGLCCYCECKIRPVATPQIEHRRPKSSQPRHTFDWDNLHLVCPTCNRTKSDKWNEAYPILDSVQDTILEHLTYRFGVMGAQRWPKSCRGKTTIEHADLNNEHLLDARMKIARWVLCAMVTLCHDPNSPAARFVWADLEEKISGEYGSLIKWLLTTFLHNSDSSVA